MKKIFAIISLAALMMPVSCMKDELAGLDNNGAADKAMTFKAVMETPGTKTTISIDGNQGTVAWAAGDDLKFDYEIGKVDSEPVFSSALAEGDIEDGVATFKAEVPEVFGMTEAEYKETLEEGATNSRHMYVAYPSAVETTYETSGYTVTIPTVQDGTFANASIALAKWNPSKPNDPLQFRNLCGLIQVTVGENVRQIKLTSSEYIAGKANVGFEDIYVPYVKNMIEADASKVITVDVTEAGTYYIAVKPGTIKDLYIEYLDADGDGVCDKLAKGDVTAERAHILPLGGFTDGSFAAAGGFFVKPDGTGDGSSWDNAANYVGLYNQLDNSKTNGTAVTMTVYMAGGTYTVNNQLNVTPAHNVKIYGGYPSDAEGYSLSGRDVQVNQTILDDSESTVKIWNLTAGTWVIDGLTLQNSNVSDGAVVLKNNINFTVRNSTFKNNTSTGTGGAAIFATALTSQNVIFENCVFSGNKASTTTNTNTGLGGAVVAVGSAATLATMTFSKCLFEKNSAALGGGAVCPRKANCRFLDCTFVDNTGTTYGDAIYVENSNAVSIYCDGCNFYYTDRDYVATGSVGTNGIISVNNPNAVLGLNNCSLSGPWAGSTAQVHVLNSKDVVLVNTTLFAQTSYPLLLHKGGDAHVINSILLNAASNGKGRGIANQSTAHIYNSVFTKVDEKQTSGNVDVTATTEKTDYLNNLKVLSNTDETFPVEPTWYGSTDHAGLMWGNKNATTTKIDDCRGKYYYYAWDGVYPEGATFTNATLAEVEEWVNAADANFATWLGDNLGKDIRGVSRDASSMWPGSYQE